ncbi:MAG TPA: heparan-alpha-glucosaminide N-acetyltransferase domain-containing protein [Smithellaceae bacterium]|jgi:predicted acyltransferase|nr:heparan-alpha-glucosaminide N-acetyltransferase domain-containing protein [Smithellaceae bacterium]
MHQKERSLPLDVFRGIAIALMILVNTPGSWQYVYAPLRHSAWHGCTLADLVFPFFLFAAGLSLAFSFTGYDNNFNREAAWRIGRRVVLIFLLGLFLNCYPPWLTDYENLRIMGVLQRIACAYGIAAVTVLVFPGRLLTAIGALVLAGHWLFLLLCGSSDPYSTWGSAALELDRLVFGDAHLYQGLGFPFEPEGLAGTMPAAVTILIGYMAGTWLRDSNKQLTLLKLTAYGTPLLFAGYLWGLILPINKPLWTGSYVLYTGGMACLLLALIVFIFDVKGFNKWGLVFSVYGMNPLALFFLSSIWIKTLQRVIFISGPDGTKTAAGVWLYQNIFAPAAGPAGGSFAYAAAHVVLFWLVGLIFYRYKLFLKV